METMTRRRRMSVSLPECVMDDMPNAETTAAIEESKAGIYAGTIDTSSMEAFKKSMGL